MNEKIKAVDIPTPLELFESMQLDLQPIFDKIVTALKAQYKIGTPVWVPVPSLGRYERSVISQALKGSGWKCEYTDDQRDGASLKITAITEPVYFKEDVV